MSDGVLRELVPGGAAIEVTFEFHRPFHCLFLTVSLHAVQVTFANRAEFVDKIIAARSAKHKHQNTTGLTASLLCFSAGIACPSPA